MRFLILFMLGFCPLWLATPVAAVDMEKGREINGTCAACHGESGQGGKKGEYPRLAGQRTSYLVEQLINFRARTRMNIPMYPYTQERELSDEDIKEISAYLNAIQLPTKMPVFTGNEDALTMLQAVERVMIIPRVDGDLEQGKQVYQKECAVCHAKTGRGHGNAPMLVGQYTSYLKRQVDLYRKHDRPHDEDDVVGGVLDHLNEKQIQDILAYLTVLQEPAE